MDRVLLLMLISYPPSLLLLGFIFSSYIGLRAGNKSGLSRQGLMTSFTGLSLATVLLLAAPVFSGLIPAIDLAMILATTTWIVLLRRYCGTGWLETLTQAIIPVITYVVILTIAFGFTILFTS